MRRLPVDDDEHPFEPMDTSAARRSTLPMLALLASVWLDVHAEGSEHGAPAPGAGSDSPAPIAAPTTAPGPWFGAEGLTRNARRLLAHIEDAGSHGLDPGRYDPDGLRDVVAALHAATVAPRVARRRATSPEPIAPAEPAAGGRAASRASLHAEANRRFERAFTDLATDLGRGVVDARTVQSRFFRDRLAPDVATLLAAIERGETDVDAALHRVTVDHPQYRRMRARTRDLLAERASGAPRVRVDTSEEFLPGQRHRNLIGIKARLIQTRDLARQSVLTPLFDAHLAAAIVRFRSRHGLEPLARIDARTLAALGRSVERELDELALSLERWRWMPRDLGERYVYINVPDYTLQLVDRGRTIVDMPVVVGETRYPTPNFSRDMSYLEFNPTWTVPASIANRELIPRERRFPGYLDSRGFDFLELTDEGLREVPRDSITPTDFETTPFPYTLRQRGGPRNALGRMKFMMPNPYAIYLHDTPVKGHFSRRERAYSNGCVRLSDPERLARVLMALDERSAPEAERVLNATRTTRLSLRTPVPTHFVYFTSWIDDDGALQRRRDVYGHDGRLREALRGRDALPSAWLAARDRERRERRQRMPERIVSGSAATGQASASGRIEPGLLASGPTSVANRRGVATSRP